MGDSPKSALAPEGGHEALQKRIRDLEAEVSELRGRLVPSAGKLPASLAGDPHWRMLANALPQFVWVAPYFGAAEFINDFWFEYTGLSRETLHLSDWKPVLHPDDLLNIASMWDRAAETRAETTFEYRVRRASDGMWRWHMGFHRPVLDDAGEIVNWIGVGFDIHDRKMAEEAVRAAEERQRTANDALRSLIDYAPEGIFVAGPDGKYVSVNPAACALLGYSSEELLAMNIRELVRPKDRDRHLETLASLKAGNTEVGEWELRSRSGEWIPVEMTARVLPDGRLQAFVHDVRERKRLEAASLHLAAIVESSDDAIVSKDLTGIIQSWNLGAERIFGYTSEEVVGKHISIIIPPDRISEEPEILRRLQRGQRVDHFETVRRRKDGTLLNVSLTISPVRNADGRVVGASKIARDITAQKRGEEALAQSRQQLRFVLDNAPAFISYIDTDYRYVRVNRAYEDWFGLPESEIRGKHISEAFGEAYFQNARNQLDRVRAGHRVAFETVACRPDGEERIFSVIYTPDRDSEGEVKGFVALLQDVTERRRSEIALREREQELSRLMAAIPDVICRFDRDLRFVYASPAIESLTGWPPHHFRGRTHHEAGLGELLSEAQRASLARIFQSGQQENLEFDFQSPSLGLRHLLALGIPERDDEGSVVSVLSIMRDVTERKQAEDARASALVREKEARQTAELLNRVGPTLAAELSLDRLVQSVTDIATELVGAEFGAFFHNQINEKGESYTLYTLSGVPRDAFSNFPMPRNTQVFAPTFRGEGIVVSPDITKDPRYGHNPPYNGMPPGHLPVRSYLAAPVHARSQEILGGLFFGHSQPERFTESHVALLSGIAAQAAIALDNARLFEQSQWTQDELERSNADLRRANQDLETFAYSASHDLQEPLRMISISAQLLERDSGTLSDQSREFLTGIKDGAGRMQALIEDLLSYTRATRQGEGPVPRLAAGEVLERVLQQLKPSIEQNRARVVVDGPLPRVGIHEVHLTQLFQNLISNALKYRGAEDPYVHISATEREGWDVFSVSDNGLGIEPRFKDQIFGLFKRLHTRAEFPGSGIGLAICKRIVEQYGGRIWLERSAPGQGSTFSFCFPVDPDA